jgi:hypothetical protein
MPPLPVPGPDWSDGAPSEPTENEPPPRSPRMRPDLLTEIAIRDAHEAGDEVDELGHWYAVGGPESRWP